jgi:hypothetical protein
MMVTPLQKESSSVTAPVEPDAPVLQLWLSGDPSELPSARRAASEAAAALGADPDAVDAVRLLVSELLTNAVLHAGTPSLLTLHDAVDAVRIVVADGSTCAPQLRRGSGVSTTGRGLRLLDLLGHAHGTGTDTRVAPDGKHVWVTVCKETVGSGAPPRPAVAATARADAPTRLLEVQLVGAPVRLWDRTSEHTNELMREFALLAIGQGSGLTDLHLPARLRRLVADLQERFVGVGDAPRAELEAAFAAGQPTVDLTYQVPAEAGPACRDLRDLLAEADDYCAQGRRLITLVSPEDQRRFRDWYLGEFVRQCAGSPPQPWTEPVP